MSMFKYPATDHKFNELLNSGMSNPTAITMREILETYKGFEGLKEMVDVVGGVGFTLHMN